jgi:hypothetical protein
MAKRCGGCHVALMGLKRYIASNRFYNHDGPTGLGNKVRGCYSFARSSPDRIVQRQADVLVQLLP